MVLARIFRMGLFGSASRSSGQLDCALSLAIKCSLTLLIVCMAPVIWRYLLSHRYRQLLAWWRNRNNSNAESEQPEGKTEQPEGRNGKKLRKRARLDSSSGGHGSPYSLRSSDRGSFGSPYQLRERPIGSGDSWLLSPQSPLVPRVHREVDNLRLSRSQGLNSI